MTPKTQVYNSVAAYIEARSIWVNTPAVITGEGKMFMIVKGQQVFSSEFLSANPKPTFEQRSGNDLNGERSGLMYGVRFKKKGR